MNRKNTLYRRLSTFLAITVLIGLALACSTGGQSENSRSFKFYGENFDTKNASGIGAVEGLLEDQDSLSTVTFKGEVTAVCQKKGCWMKLKSPNGNSVRVTFKDYGFFVPKDLAGTEVIVTGNASAALLAPDMAQHYAEDEGRAFDPEADLREISIVASGVAIANSSDQL